MYSVEKLASLKLKAEQGDAYTQLLLARYYEFGDDRGHKDPVEANKWWKAALQSLLQLAEQGHAKAEIDVADIYTDGRGTNPNYEEAAKWWQKASERGDARSKYNLGNMYERGLGVPQDFAKAFELYREAAALRNLYAYAGLGDLYSKGRGVTQDYSEATKWYLKAAEYGISHAQYGLGILSFNGQGTAQNYEEACFWLSLACKSDKERSTAERDEAVWHLTREQIVRMEARIDEWYRHHPRHQLFIEEPA